MAYGKFCAAWQIATRQTGALPAVVITGVMTAASSTSATRQESGN